MMGAGKIQVFAQMGTFLLYSNQWCVSQRAYLKAFSPLKTLITALQIPIISSNMTEIFESHTDFWLW